MCKFALFCNDLCKTGLVLVYDNPLISSWVTDSLALILLKSIKQTYCIVDPVQEK